MRRRRAEKRQILPDPKYNNLLVSRFINMVMIRGKKSVAEAIVYEALNAIAKKAGNKNPMEIFERSIDNAMDIWCRFRQQQDSRTNHEDRYAAYGIPSSFLPHQYSPYIFDKSIHIPRVRCHLPASG